MRSRGFWLAAVGFLGLLCLGLGGLYSWGRMAVGARQEAPPEAKTGAIKGLVFRLSEGKPPMDAAPVETSQPVAKAIPISDAEADRVLARLKPISAAADDTQAFSLREASLPAPRAGETISATFPPPPDNAAPPAVETGPLTIRRVQPEGEVPLADRVSLTFSQPMIPVSSQEEAAKNVPVTLTPAVPGVWRWLGAQTLIFDAGSGKRLPMATEFKLTVPAGTKSATGGVLAEAKTVAFATPAVELLNRSQYENEPQPRDPLLFLDFNQAVDPKTIVQNLTLSSGHDAFGIRLATTAEIAAAKKAGPNPFYPVANRIVAVRPTKDLPPDTSFQLIVGRGTGSLEGPRLTEANQSMSFHTFAPLRFRRGPREDVSPDGGWGLAFNNALDEDAFDSAAIKIDPEIPGMQVHAQRKAIVFYGRAKARTTYHITIAATLKDKFGQTLGGPVDTTVTVGSELPYVTGPRQSMIVGDPAAKPRVVFQSINTPALLVKLYSVSDTDWPTYVAYLAGRPENFAAAPPGRLVGDRLVRLDTKRDEWGNTGVDLSDVLGHDQHNVILKWEATVHRPHQDPDRGAVWFQSTRVGVFAEADSDQLFGWATDLATGSPLRGAEAELWPPARAAERTGRDGMVRVPLTTDRAALLRVRHGSDQAFLPATQWQYEWRTWVKQPNPDLPRMFVFDDRKLYRPGETVHIKGWVRSLKHGIAGDLELSADLKTVDWQLRDSRGNNVGKGTATVNAIAGFDFAVDLPATMNLGQAYVMVNGVGHEIDVQEFRRPEYEVTAKNEGAGPFVIADKHGADLSVTAKYYAGGALPSSDVAWNVVAYPTDYAPPGHMGFTFGRWAPWWDVPYYSRHSLGSFGWRGGLSPLEGPPQTLSGRTNSNGSHYLHLDFDAAEFPRPYAVEAEAVVQDLNQQTHAANTSLMVHPSALYVGLQGTQTFVQKGQKLSMNALVCNIDGKIITSQAIHLRAARLDAEYAHGQWKEVDRDVVEWTVNSGTKPVPTEFLAANAGVWEVRATVRDADGRLNESELTLWVAGEPPRQGTGQQSLYGEGVSLIPDKEEYKPGETASVLVRAPFPDSEALITILHRGIVSTGRLHLKGSTYTLRIPIETSFLPAVSVGVELVGSAVRSGTGGTPLPAAPARPAHANGSVWLDVPPDARKLTVTATPDDSTVVPGGKTTVTVRVRDAAGKPVPNAEAAVAVVDDSVLALAGWKLEDPIYSFYPGSYDWIQSANLRSFLVLEDPAQLLAGSGARGIPRVISNDSDNSLSVEFANRSKNYLGSKALGTFGAVSQNKSGITNGGAWQSSLVATESTEAFGFGGQLYGAPKFNANDPSATQSSLSLRANFDSLAAFAPSVRTDASGAARVPINLPDNLTRYRIIVYAVAGAKQIGAGDATLTARLPLMARPSAPRFLNYGDRFELPVVLQNQTDQPLTVAVAVRGTNLAFPKAHGLRVTVPANNRAEVRFPAQAVSPGTARFQIAAVSGSNSDAAEVSLPVRTPATTEAFATYGTIDSGAIAQPVQAPPGVVTQFGGLDITTSSTALQELTDALLSLDHYPYECAEQIASRVLANAALKDVLTAFKAADLPAPADVQASMAADIARLGEMQQDDGGFSFWTRQTAAYPYLGVHVAHAFVLARQKGYTVPPQVYNRSMEYLKQIESKRLKDYDNSMRRMITAYALYVRHLAGDTDTERARRLLHEDTLDRLGPETVGWLLAVLAGDPSLTDIRTWLNNKATETAGAAHFTFSYGDGNYLVLSSDRRADAIVLDALIADQPKSDLIPRLVRGLLDGRKRGHWQNTQEDAFILLALDRYFRTYEGTTPDFVAHVWLGDKSAGEGVFHGRTTDRISTQIPMAYLARTAGSQNLTISKAGAGRLYYRVGMRYAPTRLDLKPADYGFEVRRVYEAVDKPGDVRRDADGAWVIRAGAKVRVRLTLVATGRRYHVALTDPLPAGFEALNPELRGTESIEPDTSPGMASPRFWWWRWWEHENLRDDRAEAFTSLLWEGAYEYVYICRATTPGQFIVPPARAEEMYAPETFGRSGTDRVRIE